jgi:outer membrane protein TolC
MKFVCHSFPARTAPRRLIASPSALAVVSAVCLLAAAHVASATTTAPTRTASLDTCIEEALKNNRHRSASAFAVAAAEAQHRQALAGYWPQVGVRGGVQRSDEAPNFVVPAGMMFVPGQQIQTPAGTAVVTVPAGVLGPTEIQLPVSVPAQTIDVAPSLFPLPAQEVQLADRDSSFLAADAKLLLFDGGMRRGWREQARAGIEAAQQEARRTDLEIVDTVKRYYHGAVLARQVHRVGRDTLARMDATLALTESMYKEGSGRVSKTDFLENKVMVESLRSMIAQLERNESMAQAALANSMGLSWRDAVAPADESIAFAPYGASLEAMVASAYRFNPDWARLDAGLRALEGAVRTARSGHAPKIALTGSVHRLWNDLDTGIATPENKKGWSVAVGFELPVFDGFLTRGRIAEARARLAQLEQQQFLLRDGIGLQLKDLFLAVVAEAQSHDATLAAMEAARENADLNTRAYQNELADTEDVVQAQLMEALMTARHLKTLHDHAALQARIDRIVGTEVLRELGLAR